MHNRNHFELLGLPVAFRLDESALQDRLRRFQAAVHPDRFVSGSDFERRRALQLASAGNESRRVLLSPTLRAAYLCELMGVPVEAERNTAMPHAFLVAQLEWREELDELRADPDPDRVAAVAVRLDAERAALLRDVAVALDETHDATLAASLVRQLMFHDRLQQELQSLRRLSGARGS